jgi:hypothetical protein
MEPLSTPFRTVERRIREQLVRILGDGGFNPARDIFAITVNPWPHGYVFQYTSLSDPFWREGGELSCVVARQRFERIAIANAGAAAFAYTDAAIDQAYRAVHEVLELQYGERFRDEAGWHGAQQLKLVASRVLRACIESALEGRMTSYLRCACTGDCRAGDPGQCDSH